MSERFVDEAETIIPPAGTWHDLSVNQLIDVKNQLSNKAWDFRNQKPILSVLQRSIDQLTSMIEQRLGS